MVTYKRTSTAVKQVLQLYMMLEFFFSFIKFIRQIQEIRRIFNVEFSCAAIPLDLEAAIKISYY